MEQISAGGAVCTVEPAGSTRSELIVRAAQRRDPGAFEQLVRQFEGRLQGYVRRLCDRPEDADDVMQETWLRAYERIGELRVPAAAATWLSRVARTTYLMRLRRERRAPQVSLDEAFGVTLPEGTIGGEVPDSSRHPERAARRSELRAALVEGLAALPVEYRKIILLRDVRGLSTRAAARELQIGVPAAKMRLHRARKAMRRQLGDLRAA